ncbi:unnamed protein product [Cunninghamella blakesleeana]
MPSTVTKKQTKASPKKSTSSTSQKQKQNNNNNDNNNSKSSSSVDSDSSDSKQTSKKPNRRHHHKRKSAQPKLQQTTPIQVETRRRTRSNSAVDYAGPQFMYCSPSPTSLPKPPVVENKHPKPIQSISLDIRQTQKQQPTLYEKSLHQQHLSSKPYVIDPITDIQEKLRILLKLQ